MASLRRHFDDLMLLAPEQRQDGIARLELSETERARLRSMLEATTERVAGILDVPLERAIAGLGESDLLERLVGTQVGRYRVLELIGEGGSSSVFRAERAAGSGSQVVALKFLRTGLFSSDAERRFRREQAILAQLTHPNIARLIEADVSEAGVPYIALEYVDGLPITVSATSRALDLDERLRLFARLCRVVDTAHASLVVHRDLKPSNVLVDEHGELKVLDFGIAKLLDEDGPERTLSLAFTPEYAAPEQLTSAQPTVALDVFALGVMLAELLTGQRLRGGVRASVAVAGADKDPPNGLPPRAALARLLRGDLDAIIETALAEEPGRRYRSADALALDVERHLAGYEVHARPPSRWYRTRKFVARHRAAVMATSLLLAVALASLGTALWQGQQAKRAAERAQAEALRANTVREYLIRLFEAESPGGPRSEVPDTLTLLERGAAKAEKELADNPQVQGDLLLAIGRIYGQIGRLKDAQRTVEQSVAALRGDPPENPVRYAEALAQSGDLTRQQGRYPDALKAFDESVALLRAHAPGSSPLALALHQRALALGESGRHDEAIADYRESLALREADPKSSAYDRLRTVGAMGTAYWRARRYEEAEPLLRRAVDMALEHLGENHAETTRRMHNFAQMLADTERLREASGMFRRSLAIQRKVYEAAPINMGPTLNSLAALEFRLGHAAEADAYLKELEDLMASQPDKESLRAVSVQNNRGRITELQGDFPRALRLQEELLARNERVFGPDAVITIENTINLGRTELQLGRLEGARSAATRVLAWASGRKPPNTQVQASGHYLMAAVLEAEGEHDAARDEIAKALAFDRERHLADPWPWYALAGRIALGQRRPDEALALADEGLVRARAVLPGEHYRIGELLMVRARILAVQGQASAAADDLAQARERIERALPPHHPLRLELDGGPAVPRA